MGEHAGGADAERNAQLMAAAGAGDVERVRQLVDEGADPCFQDESDGASVLMRAAGAGSMEAVEFLLARGAPWNALDRAGMCAGEYAMHAGHQEVAEALLEAGCRAELILSAAQRRMGGAEACVGPHEAGEGYLARQVCYDDAEGRLMDADGEAVMMEWERPLMVAHAHAICQTHGDVLNVGFGLGLVDQAIQECGPRSHTIIEAHPDVHARMLRDGWDKRPGVKVVFGRWQDVLEGLGQFDGIFFDTYGEHYEDMREFHMHLPAVLRPGGVYSFFNGLAPDNAFFHAVYAEIVTREMAAMGLEAQFVTLPIGALRDKTWDGVRNRYWWSDVYYLPVCQRLEGVDQDKPPTAQEGA